ncbi:MAG TPA: hypothetical protein VHM88_19705 [Candidatus Acidoferrales bacterium]|jgi:hypothetical protein|nr:hypothetical protein [Candidatus Acidoferrales bacterium]
MTIAAANSASIPDAGEKPMRAERVVLSMPLLVYGWAVDNSAFLDEARLLSLNARGGMIALSAEVGWGQTILLVDSGVGPDHEARVVSVVPDRVGGTKIAFEFIRH